MTQLLPYAAHRSTIRRTNLGLILRHLRTYGPLSRTQIAQALNLPNSTVSKLIGELVDRRLLVEGTRAKAGAIGRPHQAVELSSGVICGLGVEVSVNYARAIALELSGEVVLDQRIGLDVRRLDSEALLDEVAALIDRAWKFLTGNGFHVTGVMLAAPGMIDRDAGVVTFAANMGWTNLAVVAGLRKRLGTTAPPVFLDNDARMGAMAEYHLAKSEGIDDLLYLTGEVGVGCGIVIDGQLIRGVAGFAGEVGHMPVDPDPKLCACGRRGCWETMVGLNALLHEVAEEHDPIRDQTRDLEERLTELRTRAAAGDPRTLAGLTHLTDSLGLGIGLLIDVLNPKAVVLGGYFTFLGEFLLDPVRRIVNERAVAPDAGGCELRLSTLGFTSAARGGAHAALEHVFHDPASIWPAPA